YGSSLTETVILPDDEDKIADKIKYFLHEGTDLIITTGGMSVDPDDVTRSAIRQAGVDKMFYGAAALPGAMLMLAYKGDVPVVGIPACALYHKTTIFDLVLPRLLTGEKPDERDLARFAHGGLCFDCTTCNYPACSFGKTG
ncbi:MAG: molybdopterin-binding protein, partial [Deltaproteobacteria bacterium]|nr:molybdopterin-binding protein [Deltaproteobacteria bacterium]